MSAQWRRRATGAAVGLLAIALAGAGAAEAQAAGSLDATFGGSGVVTLSPGTQLFGVAVQPNGEIVAAGHTQARVFVERFSTTGAVDASYVGGSGIAKAVAIAPDGRIVIAGTTSGAMFAERLTPSLTPDASFGSGGIATALPNSGGIANGVALEPDGSVVVAGQVGSNNTRAGAAHFAANGSTEWSEVPGFDQYSLISAVAAQPDGKIVFVGRQTPLQVTDALIGRLNPNGSLDSSFGGGAGVFTYHYPGGGYTSLNAVTVQNDGKIVAAGVDVGGPNAIFARLNSNGTFDSSFGAGGVAALRSATNLSNNSGAPIGANAVAIAGGGRITGTGVFDNAGTVFDAAAWALTAGGAAESSFGAGGTVTGPANQYEACALAIAPDGSLVSAGNKISGFADTNPCSINATSAGFVARYTGFGPPPPPQTGTRPSATTGGAGGIGETSAIVVGSVNPGGLATQYHFEYGATTKYGSSTPQGALAAATAATPVAATVSGLTPGATYHYRLVASNADGTSRGQDMMFTTASARPPSASTGAATGIGEVTATLGGTVNANGLPTSYHFDYGTTTRYGSQTRAATTQGAVAVAVSARLSRLKPGTTYHYRLVAANADGTSYGADRKFKTAPRLRFAVSGAASSYSVKALQRSGARFAVGCSQPCKVDGSFLISAADAKRLKLGTRQTAVAVGSVTLKRGGRGTLSIQLTSLAKSVSAQLPGLKAVLRIVATPTGGGPRVSYSKNVKFTR